MRRAINRLRFKVLFAKFAAILLASVCLSVNNVSEVKTGADQPEVYLPMLQGKKVGVVANQTSVLLPSKKHLVDFLVEQKVQLSRIFSPEHGFRGNHSAGAHVSSSIDEKTGIAIVSLYGDNRKPTAAQMEGLDVVVFDIQDVGARFYTYISTMHLVMEAAAESGVEVLVLDRPNPHGAQVDGPVLQEGYQSFVGMHQVPVLHGMTIGEYAHMINDEGWLKNGITCQLKVVPMKNWSHTQSYSLPIAPSPNLPNDLSVNLYPSLCFFEGTVVSVGRGTDKPFQVYGHPALQGTYTFTPENKPGIADHPKWENELCHGVDFHLLEHEENVAQGQFDLSYLISTYSQLNMGESFFTSFFDKLAGTSTLRKQIIAGKTIAEIEASWQADLDTFRSMRARYLLYP
ncbi:DUF1343 domain-containing protein [bacterium]|nr:DUF1343 domain-containing protein [bacterium]